MTRPVDAALDRLAHGQLSQPADGPSDGWETKLPDGQTVARSQLQAEARPLIALGPDAVPDLLPWVHHANAGIRYVAMFTLEQITGEHTQLSYFSEDRAQQDAAIATWRHWYERYAHTRPRA